MALTNFGNTSARRVVLENALTGCTVPQLIQDIVRLKALPGDGSFENMGTLLGAPAEVLN
jgi:hypothetical protein